MHARAGMRWRGIPIVLAAVVVAALVTVARAEDVVPPPEPAQDVLGTLRRTLAWYERARVAIQTANELAAGIILREEEEPATRVLRRAFDVARAQAALVSRTRKPDGTGAPPDSRRDQIAKAEQDVRESERALERARAQARAAQPPRRAALERAVEALNRRLELDRLRLELLTSLAQADASLVTGEPDLAQQIQALQESVPELGGGKAVPKPAAAAAAKPSEAATGAVRRLLALQRARNTLDELALTTRGLGRDLEVELTTTGSSVRALAEQLRARAERPAPSVEDERAFREELERLKVLAAVIPPLRAETLMLRRFASDVEIWTRALGRESVHALWELALELAGVAVALLVILMGAVVWRVATLRYIADPSWRRLSLTARNVATVAAIVLVLLVHFTSELTALVTALGFAAAGIAFALQTVILSVAGYFSMVAPNGIRVGDRVSLQGPFGYVHGEVLEIGFARIRLRELTGDGLEPTGRIVVFPNSVVFTGSFYKHPPEARHAKAA